ncbi:MAG: cation transporter [Limnochordales bacterium]|nr:cation transporter [Limnochordales bacterium]
MDTGTSGAKAASTHRRAIRAAQLSTLGLLLTSLVQGVLVFFTGSTALLADTLHNLLDCLTGAVLWLVYHLERRPPDRRLTYGWGRAEDLAGLLILLIIIATAASSAWVAYLRLRHPQPLPLVWAVAAAGLIGFLGNELVARYRLRVGREIKSAALIADGYHARADGWTSLAVLAGALGVRAGFPLADPLAAFVISLAILHIAYEAGRSVILRVLDGVETEIIERIQAAARSVPGIESVNEVRARWLGRQIVAEINVGVAPDISVTAGHQLAVQVEQVICARNAEVARVIVHVDPADEPGERFHRPAAPGSG